MRAAPSRVVPLAAGLLALGAVGLLSALWWPSSEPALPCPPEEVRWFDGGSTLVARCAGGAGGVVPAAAALTLGVKLDLNTASESELALARGVGPSLARAIVRARSERGGFQTWDEVDEVPGVGPAKLDALRSVAALRQAVAGLDGGQP